jgi:hypothetical protein
VALGFQIDIPSWIAHHDFRDVWLEQVVQPGGPGSFFKCDMQVSAQPLDKLQNGHRFRFEDGVGRQNSLRPENQQ